MNPQRSNDSDATPAAGGAEATLDAEKIAEAQPTARPEFSRRARRRIKVSIAVVAMLLSLVIVDSVIAGRTEAKISNRIYAESNLVVPPDVVVTGLPYSGAALVGEMPSLTVNAQDVDMPGLGLMTVYTSAQYLEVTPDDVFNGTFEDVLTKKFFRRLQLDGVLLGQRMGINDLQIQNQDDISPLGGWETEAIFEGTVPGFSDTAVVAVRLRLHNGEVRIIPDELVRGPESHDEDAKSLPGEEIPEDIAAELLEAFSASFPDGELPLPDKATRIFVAGGSIFVEAEALKRRVSLTDFAPSARRLDKDQEPGL